MALKANALFDWQRKSYDVRIFKDMVQIMGVRGEPIVSLSEDEAIALAGKIQRMIEDRYAVAYENTKPEGVF